MRHIVSPAVSAAFVPALLLLAAAPQTARAQVTGYNTQVAFNAAATTPTVYGFEGIAGAGLSSSSPSLTPLTVTTGGNGGYFVDSATYAGGSSSLNGTDSLAGAINSSTSPGNSTTTIGLGGSYTAFGTEFGFRIGGSTGRTGTVSVQLFNGATAIGNAFSSAVPAAGTFIGLTSTQAFDRATFTSTAQSGDAYQQFDNVRVGTNNAIAAAALEPGTLSLIGLGLVTGAFLCSHKVGISSRRRAFTRAFFAD